MNSTAAETSQINKSRLAAYGLAIFLLVLPVALLVPMPEGGRAWSGFTDMFHAPMFAILAGLIHVFALRWVTSFRGVVWVSLLCWLTVASLSLGLEWLQSMTGRSASFADARSNVIGVTAGLLFSLGWRADRWRRLLLTSSVLLVLAAELPFLAVIADCGFQTVEFPHLASFESPTEILRVLASAEAEMRRARDHVTDGEWSLRVRFSPGRYPNIIYTDPVRNWSPYQEFLVDVYLVNDTPAPFSVKIEDQEHELNGSHPDDRFDRRFLLTPGWNFIRVPLADVRDAPAGRHMDLRRIRRFQLYTIRNREPVVVHIDNIRLE